MKTHIKSLALALSLAVVTAATTVAQANPGDSHKAAVTYKTGIYTTATGKLQIALDKATGGPVDIRLVNADGSVLYNQHLGKKDHTFRARLNLNELPDGSYKLEITNGVDKTEHTVTVATKLPATPERVILTEAIASRN